MAIDYALRGGAKLAIARLHSRRYELIAFDGGSLREHSYSRSVGVGVEVYTVGRGYSFTTSTRWDDVRKAVERALALSKLSNVELEPLRSSGGRARYRVECRVDPFTVDIEEKVGIVRSVNVESSRREGVASAVSRLAFESDYRLVVTSEGFTGESHVVLSGFSHLAVARQAGVMERVGDSRTFIGCYENIESGDWLAFASEVDSLALKAVQAKTPPPGSYRVIVDNELVGVVIHEALGHASEGDSVTLGSSILAGMRGSRLAGEHVTVVDSGLVEGGYPVPFDDEGVVKRETVAVDRGVLVGYLTSRVTAGKLGLEPTGNARAESYDHQPIVRQTNLYIKPGDWRVEELFEGFTGLYVRDDPSPPWKGGVSLLGSRAAPLLLGVTGFTPLCVTL